MEHTEQQGLTEIDTVPFLQKVSEIIFSNMVYLYAITLYRINDWNFPGTSSDNSLEMTDLEG